MNTRMHMIILCVVCLCTYAQEARAQTCTHYASPTGTGTTCTVGTPCQIASWWPLAGPGKTLCLNDGTYTGASGVIFPTVSGTASQRITVRALNDGAVLVDGQDARRPLDMSTNYVTVIGINFRNGSDHALRIRGNNNIVQRVVAWQDQDRGENMTLGPGGNNLLEDCALFGRGRKVVAAGSDGGNGNTIRRCWVRHEGHQGTDGNPSNPYEIGYMQNTVTSENVIVTANTFGFGVTSAQVLLAMFSSVGSALLGSIGYYDGSSAWGSGAGIGQFWLAGGSHAGEGNCTKDAVVRDVVGIITPAYVEYAQ